METAFIDLFTVILLNCVNIGILTAVVLNQFQRGVTTINKAVYVCILVVSIAAPLYYLL